METTNQWVSRRTYQEMLDRLGGFTPQWQDKIVKSGYGYSTWVKRFDRLVESAGLSDKDILEGMKKIHSVTDRFKYKDKIVQLLSEKGGKNKSKIKEALEVINKDSASFEKAIKRID